MDPWLILIAALSGVAYLSLVGVQLRAFTLAERSANVRTVRLAELLVASRLMLTEAGASREARLIRAVTELNVRMNIAEEQIVETIGRSSDALKAYWNDVRDDDRENAQRFVNDMQAAAFAQWPTPRDLQVLYERRGVAQEREKGIADGAAERRRREAERRRRAAKEAS